MPSFGIGMVLFGLSDIALKQVGLEDSKDKALNDKILNDQSDFKEPFIDKAGYNSNAV